MGWLRGFTYVSCPLDSPGSSGSPLSLQGVGGEDGGAMMFIQPLHSWLMDVFIAPPPAPGKWPRWGGHLALGPTGTPLEVNDIQWYLDQSSPAHPRRSSLWDFPSTFCFFSTLCSFDVYLQGFPRIKKSRNNSSHLLQGMREIIHFITPMG